ncbi:2-keto-3-deoxy-6-phosphogluconate aldolase [Synechococcus sp. A15-127]|uniref:bifunctional 4-hydroxy-2-oxoglutarate aldolase/2-dehydro-3-deoxy-phosphogluconate aldolase n=1 Tax=Synechococcus sp. A15-127 TaxID=1050624 RepID=UPI001862FCDD|nr:bifunctional 4-hydroxy-2-oxoglutarate aldolase/2-dehydro-3-deoxy-phosphogluconate aldolase [Synechococcus sp. A15-127]QNI93452.1 2-keto-3-deoxy-6-phosphogluconate aldolase [Synechococcus sp. A15-127]
MPSTSDRPESVWRSRQDALIASLQQQPLLVVVRPDEQDLAGQAGSGSLLDQLRLLQDSGLVHVEVAWRDHHLWSPFIRRLRETCPQLLVGAASVVQQEALAELADLDLSYAMSPCWDPILLDQARRQGILLVPGVFSPTEVMQAIRCGCRLVKLFPAATLGCRYWSRLLVPLGERPAVIAAGGLAVSDLEQWLSAGHDAVALGRRVIGPDGVDEHLLRWLQASPMERRCHPTG